ncbi:hypothetical protein [Mucilaginibacter psychrotolerans]|uniref:hypothetical protein n=1 Tax=Mucilaginibacter psychrotolerans TaxID=1524096 RepID=UPI0010D3093F|nr:hypothetical protein [Mucilaginibacter psychrotolerans]
MLIVGPVDSWAIIPPLLVSMVKEQMRFWAVPAALPTGRAMQGCAALRPSLPAGRPVSCAQTRFLRPNPYYPYRERG